MLLPLPKGDKILHDCPPWQPLGELPRWPQQLGWCGSAEKSPAPDVSPLVCLNSPPQGESRWVMLAGLRPCGSLLPGATGFSATSLFTPFLKQLHQVNLFTLAGCWGVGTALCYQQLCRVSHAPPVLPGLFQ